MILGVISFMILSSGSVLATAIWGKRYEDVLPLSLFSNIIILYLFGLAGFLKSGVYAVLAICLVLYLISIYLIIRRKSLKSFMHNTFTPAFLIFATICLIITICNVGRFATAWDEFSHWADVVKAMHSINDFSTSSLSNSAFQSYPPAMSLFQYQFQILNNLINGNQDFVEGYLYFAYQLASYTLFMPFLNKLKINNVPIILLVCSTIFILPSVVFRNAFETIYVDMFLSILSGFAISYIYINQEMTRRKLVTLLMSMFVLSLSKDVGMVMAVFISIYFILDHVVSTRFIEKEKVKRYRAETITISLASAFVIAAAKLSWSLMIHKDAADIAFSKRVDLISVMNVIINRDQSDYRWVTVINFINEYFRNSMPIGDGSIKISYLLATIVVTVIILAIVLVCRRGSPAAVKRIRLLGIICVGLMGLYIPGLCITYISKFSVYEATNLASYNRYMNIVFSLLVFVIFTVALSIIENLNRRKTVAYFLVFYIILLCSPVYNNWRFVSGDYAYTSQISRAPYTEFAETSKMMIDNCNARIYLISQEDKGYDYWVMRYSMRPLCIPLDAQWSIGKQFYEDDIWTQEMTAEKWQQKLTDKYDYVMLYRINNYFIDTFSSVFKDASTIGERRLFKINRDTGLLELCRN